MEDSNAAPPQVPPPTPIAGLAILAIVVVLLVAYMAVALQFVADTALVGAFMLLWYWANNGELEISRFPAALVGSVVGIAVAWFLAYGPTHMGGLGMALSLVALLLALYLDIIKAIPKIVNNATMLFVTLAAAPLVQLHVNWGQLLATTVLGGLFFAAAVEGLKRVAARFAPAD
ncbi:hypothetical protein [Novosphingobium sp.]|uniref:hypothetical protein n=1 Tax=Novosphingobium sp. TaxID=1874826 RepID=UPI0025DE659B|nr:hypothetical protein [Novosphingobium sp.]